MNNLAIDLAIAIDRSILDAVKCIESGRVQIAFVVDGDTRLAGVVTNGDVRRYLLQGGTPDAPVTACMNTRYRCVHTEATREEILKAFDLGHNAIPQIDGEGRLVNVITPDDLPAKAEMPVLARARAPARVSFCGGGSDLTYYFVDNPGAVLSCTVAMFAHATLIPRQDGRIRITSEDLALEEEHETLGALLKRQDKGLLSTIVSVIKPTYGFDLSVWSDFPVGSGLGGSSAVTTAVIAAFNELRLDCWSPYEIAELAFQAERLRFGIAGGWQDQYASAFGGFNLIEFEGLRNLVHPVRLEESVMNELEACLLLCDTQIAHDSGKLHDVQRSEARKEEQAVRLAETVKLCRLMHRHLMRGELSDFGRCMHDGWQLKREFSSMVTNDALDALYAAACGAGALGGKLLGAGNGGFFLFFVPPHLRSTVAGALREHGCRVSSFRFESRGVVSWRTKIQ